MIENLKDGEILGHCPRISFSNSKIIKKVLEN